MIDFLPEKGKYDLIVLFIGGNDAYERNVPSSVSEQDIANEISKLADELSLRAPKIFILGIPHRGEYRKRASDVNGFLRTKKETGNTEVCATKFTAYTILKKTKSI